MKASYHTHTSRCHHAEGTDEEYVKAAIAAGTKVLGFSDHAPMNYKNGYVSYYKMLPEELAQYCSSVLSLREKYADKIEIRLGLETEYYPTLWEESLKLWQSYPIEYLILGQHFVGEETDEPRDPSPTASEDKARVIQYVDRVITAIGTGRITYVAHPDLINYTGADEDFFREELSRLIREAKRLEIPLEYNLLGMSGRRSYPKNIFWEEVSRIGAKAVIGCDSHTPNRVLAKKEIERAERYLDSLHIEVLDEIKLRKPF